MQKINIRKAELSDLPVLCDMLSHLFSIETDFTPDREKQKAALELLMTDAKSIIIVACRGCAAGMVTGQIIISTAAGGYSLLIEDMYVLPEFRRQGIASMLISHLIEWAKNNCSCNTFDNRVILQKAHNAASDVLRAQLVADSTNAPAIALYDKLGFSTGRMTGMYKMLDNR